MTQADIRREAVARQGTVLRCKSRAFRIDGDPNRAVFLSGGEGLVHRATNLDTNVTCRIKCFWQPTPLRRKRCEMLVKQNLADLNKAVADALGGAPYEVLQGLGTHTPFAVVMKDVRGSSWKDLRENALQRSRAERYPPASWPPLRVRATWGYGLATAVQKMEQHGFIHADLSDGNVMVTPHGPNAGDMALVDFDAFVHPGFPHLDTTCKGSEGFAAPEIWKSTSVSVGSDRVGMAILIQDFLMVGDPSLTLDHAFGWRYTQDEIASRRAEAHAPFSKLYPELAKLVTETLRAPTPAKRPEPEAWRSLLRALAGAAPVRLALRSVLIHSHPIVLGPPIAFGDQQSTLDLSSRPFEIHAKLERNRDGSIDVVVQAGATINVQDPNAKTWKSHAGGARIPVTPGMVLFDPAGRMNARIEAHQTAKLTAATRS